MIARRRRAVSSVQARARGRCPNQGTGLPMGSNLDSAAPPEPPGRFRTNRDMGLGACFAQAGGLKPPGCAPPLGSQSGDGLDSLTGWRTAIRGSQGSDNASSGRIDYRDVRRSMFQDHGIVRGAVRGLVLETVGARLRRCQIEVICTHRGRNPDIGQKRAPRIDSPGRSPRGVLS